MQMKIGKVLKMIRLSLSLKQCEMAGMVGVASNYLSRIESGKEEPSLKVMRQISTALGLPNDLLIFLSVDIPNMFELNDICVEILQNKILNDIATANIKQFMIK